MLSVMEKNFRFKQYKNSLRTYDNICQIPTGQRDDYTTDCLLGHNYFNKYYKMVAIHLSKNQALDADPEAIQQINFTGILFRQGNVNTRMFFVIEEANETILDLLQETVKVI